MSAPTQNNDGNTAAKSSNAPGKKSLASSNEYYVTFEAERQKGSELIDRWDLIKSQNARLSKSQSRLDGTQEHQKNLNKYLKGYKTVESHLYRLFSEDPDPSLAKRQNTRSDVLKLANTGCDEASELIERIRSIHERQTGRESVKTATGNDSDEQVKGQ